VIPFNWCLPRYLPDFFPIKNKFMKATILEKEFELYLAEMMKRD